METTVNRFNRDRSSADKDESPLEVHLGYWLRLVSNEVSGTFAQALQERQISVAQWVTMNRVGTMPEPTPARVATAMGMTRGAISKILDKLEAKKLVVRTTSLHDNRVQLLCLTGAGKRLLPALTAIADRNDKHFFDALDQDEQALLRGLLRKLADGHHITNTRVD